VAPAPQPEARRAGSTQRRWRGIGARKALTGQVDDLDGSVVGREQVSAFDRQLDRRYASLRRLSAIQDTWSIHRHPDVLATLATLPRLEPVSLPTSAPWLNPIEKRWRGLNEQVLNLHRLAGDWLARGQRVRAFLDQFPTGRSAAGHALLRYVGLRGEGTLAQACRAA